jgi:hypothetical protein
MDSDQSTRSRVESPRDILLVGLATAKRSVTEAMAGLSFEEFNWEPLTGGDRLSDLQLAPDEKKVWRVYSKEGVWIYDYTPEVLDPPPFTTIAWILNHIAQTGDMYLYCVETGKPEGIERFWDDLPVYPYYVHEDEINLELNRASPAPWGEMRSVYQNLWGGIICHTIEHAAQIAVLKDRIRFGY